jgi:hypothetical protein
MSAFTAIFLGSGERGPQSLPNSRPWPLPHWPRRQLSARDIRPALFSHAPKRFAGLEEVIIRRFRATAGQGKAAAVIASQPMEIT